MCVASDVSWAELVQLTQDGGAPRLGLLGEKVDEIGAHENVEVDRHFVEEEHVPLRHEAHAELDAAALTVGDLPLAAGVVPEAHGVHVPVEVYIQDLEETVPARAVPVPAD